MYLVAIVISLVVEWLFVSLESLRRTDWLRIWHDRLRAHVPERWWNTPLGPLVVAIPPLALIAIVFGLLSAVWGLLGFLFAVAVLLYSLGPRNLHADVERYLSAREAADDNESRWYASQMVSAPLPETMPALDVAVERAVFVQAHERLFGVIFWFLVLGPVGALLYRIAAVLRAQDTATPGNPGFTESVRHLHAILAWVPARLCLIGYALAGNFVDAMARLREVNHTWADGSERVLTEGGRAALRADAPADQTAVAEAFDLVKRTLFVWLVVIALLVLARVVP
ncbi:regulatory signaling modulator protein AmpE [Ectothiorhodospiraceae bacterium 2226]|nr:regulatory signaling modulator protein AmpE [Ectothiorhodospiraceae bacterium 2226]